MKKLILAGAIFTSSVVMAGDLKVSLPKGVNLNVYGGLSAGYFYTTNPSEDSLQITNAIVGVSSEGSVVSFDLAFGGSLWSTVYDGGQGDLMSVSVDSGGATDGFGILWGYVSISPTSNLTIDAGVLTTNIGYELADTYTNPNITFGTTWYAQPFIYPGARVTFSLNDNISFYAEYNQEYESDNFAVGSLGSLMGIDYALTYYDYGSGVGKNLIDVVLGTSLGGVDVAVNLDYQWLDDSAKSPGQDDSGLGLALYVIPSFGNLKLPLRFEYFDGGSSGIYEGGKGYSFTLTPTYSFSDNYYVRAELAYLNTDDALFNGKDNKTTLAVEAGFKF